MKRTIIIFPNEILRKKTEVIEMVDEGLIGDMEDLKLALSVQKEHAAGLAATQIGLDRRMFGLLRGKDKEMIIYINPRIESVRGDLVRPMMVFEDGTEEVFLEGCLSFPDLFGVVKRYLEIEGSWEEIVEGKLKKMKGKFVGMEAIAFQHESEHLDGILFVDHVKKEGGEFYRWKGDVKIKWDIDKVVGLER